MTSADLYSRDEHICKPGAQHRAGVVRGGWAIGQLWLFWVAPIIGATLAGVAYRWLGEPDRAA